MGRRDGCPALGMSLNLSQVEAVVLAVELKLVEEEEELVAIELQLVMQLVQPP